MEPPMNANGRKSILHLVVRLPAFLGFAPLRVDSGCNPSSPVPAFLVSILFVGIALCTGRAESVWAKALPGWTYEFPRDHFLHSAFKSEWWYFTGELKDASGRRFGYQVTFFREGVRPPSSRGETRSRFIVGDLKFAHFAVTDLNRQRFIFQQKLSRGAFGEAGFADGERIAWIENWALELKENQSMRLRASDGSVGIDFRLHAAKPWIIHGRDGVSVKAEAEGHASHYYSGTRMRTTGTLRFNSQTTEVNGESWFDHEWASNQLAPEQIGWNWISVQLNDGTEVMLYQMRRREAEVDRASSGTFIGADGSAVVLGVDDYLFVPGRIWTSRQTGGRYPVTWELRMPKLGLQLELSAGVDCQELALKPVAYWEGIIDARGSRAGRPVLGHGFLEMTGYAGELRQLSSTR